VGTATRIASHDAEIAGTRVPAGTPVAAVLASANRDPARWSDPDRFEIRRERLSHRAFGHGPHFCVGHALARTEIGTGLRLLLQRFPALRLSAPVEHVGWEFRGPRRVEVRLR
jgi:cytochrome P450